MRILIEATVVGFVMLVLSYLIKNTVLSHNKLIFLTGFIGHLLFEALGTNKWYCKHGNACKSIR